MSSGAATACSVVIDNYNNGRYLGEAIESALSQDAEAVEVVVVDDGSTDDSRSVIAAYRERITPVLKENGGQGSALNAGFAACHGDVVIFLDSDDRLEPWAVRTAVELLVAQPDASKLHWPLRVIDAHGIPTGEMNSAELDAGELSRNVLAGGPYGYRWTSTSGNAWPRRVLEQIMPVDEVALTQCVDNYLCALAPLFGPVLKCESMSCWREHATNYTASPRPFDERLEEWITRFEAILAATELHASERSLPFDRDAWLAESWFHRIDRAVRLIDATVPPRVPVVLLDQDSWEVGGTVRGRRCIPFPEWKGAYAGLPADEQHATAALAAVTQAGRIAVAVAWPAFWWLEYYGLGPYLAERFEEVAATPDVRLFLSRDARS